MANVPGAQEGALPSFGETARGAVTATSGGHTYSLKEVKEKSDAIKTLYDTFVLSVDDPTKEKNIKDLLHQIVQLHGEIEHVQGRTDEETQAVQDAKQSFDNVFQALKEKKPDLLLDKNFVLQFSRDSKGAACKYAHPDLMKDEEFVNKLIELDIKNLQYVDDKELVMKNIMKRPSSVQYLSDRLKKDSSFVLELFQRDRNILKYIVDKELLTRILSKYPSYLTTIRDTLRHDRDFVHDLVRKHLGIFEYLEDELRNDRSFVLNLVKNDPSSSYLYYKCILKHLDNELSGDRNFILELVKYCPEAFMLFTAASRQDRNIVLEVAKLNGDALRYADKEVLKDYEVVYRLLALDIKNLQFIEDKDLVMKVIKENPSAVQYVNNSLKKDKEFVYRLLALDIKNLQFIEDKDLVMKVIKENPSAMQYVNNFLKKGLVCSYGVEAFKYLDKELQTDRDFLKATLEKSQGFIDKIVDYVFENNRGDIISAILTSDIDFSKVTAEEQYKIFVMSDVTDVIPKKNVIASKRSEFAARMYNETDMAVSHGAIPRWAELPDFMKMAMVACIYPHVDDKAKEVLSSLERDKLLNLIIRYKNKKMLELLKAPVTKDELIDLFYKKIHQAVSLEEKERVLDCFSFVDIENVNIDAEVKELCSQFTEKERIDLFSITKNLKLLEILKSLIPAETFKKGMQEKIQNASKSEIMYLVRQDERWLQYVDDKDLVKETVSKSPSSFQYLCDSLKKDKPFVFELVLRHPNVLKYINDKEQVIGILSDFPPYFEHLPGVLKQDKNFVLELIKKQPAVFRYIDDVLKKNRDFLVASVKNNPAVFQWLENDLKTDRSFILELVKNNAAIFQHIDDVFKKDKEIQLAAGIEGFKVADRDLQTNREFLKSFFMNSQTTFNKIVEYCGQNKREDIFKVILSLDIDFSKLSQKAQRELWLWSYFTDILPEKELSVTLNKLRVSLGDRIDKKMRTWLKAPVLLNELSVNVPRSTIHVAACAYPFRDFPGGLRDSVDVLRNAISRLDRNTLIQLMLRHKNGALHELIHPPITKDELLDLFNKRIQSAITLEHKEDILDSVLSVNSEFIDMKVEELATWLTEDECLELFLTTKKENVRKSLNDYFTKFPEDKLLDLLTKKMDGAKGLEEKETIMKGFLSLNKKNIDDKIKEVCSRYTDDERIDLILLSRDDAFRRMLKSFYDEGKIIGLVDTKIQKTVDPREKERIFKNLITLFHIRDGHFETGCTLVKPLPEIAVPPKSGLDEKVAALRTNPVTKDASERYLDTRRGNRAFETSDKFFIKFQDDLNHYIDRIQSIEEINIDSSHPDPVLQAIKNDIKLAKEALEKIVGNPVDASTLKHLQEFMEASDRCIGFFDEMLLFRQIYENKEGQKLIDAYCKAEKCSIEVVKQRISDFAKKIDQQLVAGGNKDFTSNAIDKMPKIIAYLRGAKEPDDAWYCLKDLAEASTHCLGAYDQALRTHYDNALMQGSLFLGKERVEVDLAKFRGDLLTQASKEQNPYVSEGMEVHQLNQSCIRLGTKLGIIGSHDEKQHTDPYVPNGYDQEEVEYIFKDYYAPNTIEGRISETSFKARREMFYPILAEESGWLFEGKTHTDLLDKVKKELENLKEGKPDTVKEALNGYSSILDEKDVIKETDRKKKAALIEHNLRMKLTDAWSLEHYQEYEGDPDARFTVTDKARFEILKRLESKGVIEFLK